MSRILKNLIKLDDNVSFLVHEDKAIISKKSSNENLSVVIKNYVNISIIDGSYLKVEPKEIKYTAHAGTIYKKLYNMNCDIVNPFKYKLKLSGVGFKVFLDGRFLFFSLGRSHDDVVKIPEGIVIEIDSDILFTCKGIDRELVTNFCAYIKKIKPVEFYKGKGIIEPDKVIKLKVGKKN